MEQSRPSTVSDAKFTEFCAEFIYETLAASPSVASQAGYYVGVREWWRLRKLYETAKGKNFQLMEFHDRSLAEGALPIGLLEKIVLAE